MSGLTVLGIDPGYGRCGWGVVTIAGNRVKSLGHGVIETSAKEDFARRLLIINKELKRVIHDYHPDEIAVEELYFSKNVKTAIDVGQARGVILLTCALANKPVAEYKPVVIKQAVTGYGQAAKKQVQHMIKLLLNLKAAPRLDDAADALAIAICHGQNRKSMQILNNRKVSA